MLDFQVRASSLGLGFKQRVGFEIWVSRKMLCFKGGLQTRGWGFKSVLVSRSVSSQRKCYKQRLCFKLDRVRVSSERFEGSYESFNIREYETLK